MALTVTVHTVMKVGVDEMGDDIMQPGIDYEMEVKSIYPTSSTEPGEPNRDLVSSGLTILAHESDRIGPHDEVTVPGHPGRWQVVGEPLIFDERSNPVRRRGVLGISLRPGLNVGCVQINLEKVTG